MTREMAHEVLVGIEGAVGHITLNRPAALNALTLGMVRAIDRALTTFAALDDVTLVLMTGAGDRAFCAGGDIRAIYDAVKAGAFGLPTTFFREEYRLNARIARYRKPIVAVMDGVTMGGGIGLGGHASHRIVTEKSLLAMPETRIGFFPDVGGTYLLAKAPGELGTYAGLAGARLKAADAILAGLADRYVPQAKLADLVDALHGCGTAEEVWATLDAEAGFAGGGMLATARGWIDRCFVHDRAEDIVAALQASPEAEAKTAADEILGNSPSSVKVTLEALRRARRLGSLEACLDQEFRLSLARLHRPDFLEGVRAAVVDKDRQPKWQPAQLAEVTKAEVDSHFQPLSAEDWGVDELGLAVGI